ncbi:hypothetical protein AB0N05_19455 [Nocardia sp. NPDC051030]|uniref:hypothetical protein n=1 Tax=Nocardia sp. NPDC051030 TaxID=3155162 RepID=UPI00341B3003
MTRGDRARTHRLLPALRAAADDWILIADGFSCRTQADQLAGHPARHLAQFLLDP